MQPLAGCHCDANSYYTRVKQQRVMEAARFFAALAELDGFETVTLLRKKRYRGYLGGHPESRERDREVLKISP